MDLVVPRGAFYIFPRVGDGDEFAARLGAAGVITVPGSAFGVNGKPHIRISYAVSEDNLRLALERMKEVV